MIVPEPRRSTRILNPSGGAHLDSAPNDFAQRVERRSETGGFIPQERERRRVTPQNSEGLFVDQHTGGLKSPLRSRAGRDRRGAGFIPQEREHAPRRPCKIKNPFSE